MAKNGEIDRVIEKPQGADESAINQLRRVIDETSKKSPNPESVEELRVLLKQYPTLWKIAGDLAAFAIDRILNNASSQVIVRESAKHGIEEKKRDLGYERASALERLLIENVAVCWLQMYTTQCAHARSVGGSISIASAEYWERRLTRTHARYMRACETLARVRRLLLPSAMQVNIGTQQVNVAQGVPLKQIGGDNSGSAKNEVDK